MFLITPDDSGITPFKIGRQVEVGDELVPDPGQIIGPTDGERVFVYQDRVEVNTLRLMLLGLSPDEALAFEEYVRSQLKGSVEPFTLVYAYGRNLVPHSERYSPAGGDPQYFETGSNPPTVTEKAVAGPEGYPLSADTIAFQTGQSVWRASGVLDGYDNSETVYVSGLAKVTDAGGSLEINANSDGVAEDNFTIPDDGGWHPFLVSWTGWGDTWVDFELEDTGTARTMALARYQVTVGGPWPFEPKPFENTYAGCRLLPGRTSLLEPEPGLFNIDLTVRQEVTA